MSSSEPVVSSNSHTSESPNSNSSSDPKNKVSTSSSSTNIKRIASPCPNIDVRQIPLEQNLPPPKQPVTVNTSINLNSCQLFGATSQPPTLNNFFSTNQIFCSNAGFSILPLPFATTTTTTATLRQPTSSNFVLNPVSNPAPLFLNDPTSLIPPALQNSITISLVEQKPATAINNNVVTTSSTDTSCTTIPVSNIGTIDDSKEPLSAVKAETEKLATNDANKLDRKGKANPTTVKTESGGNPDHNVESSTKQETERNTAKAGESCTLDTKDHKVAGVDSDGKDVKPPSLLLVPTSSTELGTHFIQSQHSTLQQPLQSAPLVVQSMNDPLGVSTSTTTTLMSTASDPNQPLRYPAFFQTIQPQPIMLNSGNHGGAPLILSSPQPNSDGLNQSLFFEQPQMVHSQDGGTTTLFSQPTTTTMLLDPTTCGGFPPNFATLGNIGGPPGGKKKKKRLSKKQQQQQAQMQLQQQLLLQQLYQQQQATMPLTILPNAFTQGISLQPMNFIQAPTILTLPNLILNPMDGTLFIQPPTPIGGNNGAQMQPMKLGSPFDFQQQTEQGNNNPLFNSSMPTGGMKLEPVKTDGSVDDTRQNPTPDSSTNDIQLGIGLPTGAGGILSTNQMGREGKKSGSGSGKNKLVSSSTMSPNLGKRVSKILPKIDSTTTSIDNG